jgi:hypothetical protein
VMRGDLANCGSIEGPDIFLRERSNAFKNTPRRDKSGVA